MTYTTQTPIEQLRKVAGELKLYGLLAHWDELSHPIPDGLIPLLNWEEEERQRRGLQAHPQCQSRFLQTVG
jgi:hypothetical protein